MEKPVLSQIPKEVRIRCWSLLCLENMAQFSAVHAIHILEKVPFVHDILAKFAFQKGKKLDIYMVQSFSYFNGSGKYQRGRILLSKGIRLA